MTKENFRIARYEGRQIGAVNIEKARLDDDSDVYFIRSDSGSVEKVNPTLVMTRKNKKLEEASEAAKTQNPQEWADVTQTDVTVEVVQGDDVERRLQTAVLAHAALADTLIDQVSPMNHWIREMGDESVGVVDPAGIGSPYEKFKMRPAKVIVQEMGARGVSLADGFQGDAWDVLGNYGAVITNADITGRAEPLHIPRQRSLAERLSAMTPDERIDYEHLDT